LDILADSICHGCTIAEFTRLEITFPYSFCNNYCLGFAVPNSIAITLTWSIAEYYNDATTGSSLRSLSVILGKVLLSSAETRFCNAMATTKQSLISLESHLEAPRRQIE
jgi:hypothetical protein